MKFIRKHGIEELATHLGQLDPDLHWDEWSKAMMVIYNETGGSEEGFALVDAWSKEGVKYEGTTAVRRQWNTFKRKHKNPVLLGTLIWMVRKYKRAA